MLRRGMVWAYFGCVFAYVGSEQGTADWISKFLMQYHGFDPHTVGASAVSWFWGMMTAGCFLGMILLKAFDSRSVLLGFAVGALAALTAALFGPATVSLYAFPAIGFFASIMWPTVISLGLNSVKRASRVVCRDSVHGDRGRRGGSAGDRTRLAMWSGCAGGCWLLYLTFGCVLSVGFWARPIVTQCDVQRSANVEHVGT